MTTPTQFELQIHQHLLEGDPVAPEDLAEAYLTVLQQRLRGRWRWLRDETLLYDAATDALFAYVQHPTRYDPAKASLLAYLTMSAHRDLSNTLEREGRRDRRVISLEDVAQRGAERNILMEDRAGDPAEVVAESMAEHEWAARLLEAFPDPLDRRLVYLIVEGERPTALYSAVLGIGDRDEAEQRRIVKQHKDRIKKRLQRWGEQFRERT